MTPRTPRSQLRPAEFEIDDAKSFDENLSGFLGSLADLDPVLAVVVARELPKVASGETPASELWNAMKRALDGQGQ